MRFIFFCLIISVSFHSYCQLETANWFFSNKAGLKFLSGKPVADTLGLLSFGRSATMSTKNGRLLFYTNGYNVWDSTHSIMPNGSGLNTDTFGWITLIVPRPDSIHLFYIFSSKNIYTSNGLIYSELNMKLNSGKGDIVPGKRMIPLLTPMCDNLTATLHNNQKDYWVLTHKYNSDTICAYLISSTGVNQKPVKSATGIHVSNINGYMKISPDGKKIASIYLYGNSFVTIGNFDASTGKVSNVYKAFQNVDNIGGLEFSPNSKFLYIPENSNAIPFLFKFRIFQFDATANSESVFNNSKRTIDSLTSSTNNNYGSYGVPQLALDGKIYLSSYHEPYLHVIHAPDSLGFLCRPQQNFVNLKKKIALGSLPNFISSYFERKSFEVSRNCFNDSTFFKISKAYKADSVMWDFGDTVSGKANSSKKDKNVFHIFNKSGFYKVTMISYYANYTDTFRSNIYIKDPKPYLGRDTSYCNSFALIMQPKNNYLSYQWNTGSKKNNIITYDKGTFWLRALDSAGCWGSDTIAIKNPGIVTGFSIKDTGLCLKNNIFRFKETTTYKDDKQQQSTWYFEDNTSVGDSVATKSFTKPGTYTIKLISKSVAGCKDSLSRTVYVYPQSTVSYSINDSDQCLKGNSFDFVNGTKDTGIIRYQWDLADKTQSNLKDVTNKNYSKDSSYKIRLISTTLYNCKDTVSKKITVLPNPRASFIYDLACSKTITKFQFTGTKPASPIITSFRWNFNNEATSSLENPSHKFASAGTSTTTLILASDNGCTDTLKKTIIIKPQSKADFTANDVCETDSAVFINKSQDATSYNWRFGDGQTSNLQTPKHKYHITSTTTYNVSLVAVVANGCSDSIGKAISINSNPNSNFTHTLTGTKVDLKATVQGNTKYQWKFGNSDSVTNTNGNYTFNLTKPEHYKICLKVTNLAGCISQTCKDITVGISPTLKPSGFKIYPNPNNGNFSVEIENPASNVSIEVYNLVGELVKKVERAGKVTTVDLNVEAGIYLVRVKNGGVVWNQKIIVTFGEDTKR